MKKLALLALAAVLLPACACAAALVDINTADEAALETLSGIGPVKAAAIIEYRGAHGPFAATEDIEQVKGIGPATFATIQASITVGATSSAAVASATPPVAPAATPPLTQPQPPAASSQKMQGVEPASTLSEPAHAAETVSAPATTSELAAAGAALPAPPAAGGAGISSVIKSPWTLGALGILAFSAAAFMVL